MSHEVEMNVVLEGKGKSKQDAFINAISFLQKKISSSVKGTVIRIEPLDVNFVEGTETRFTEKFFFFFMKREVSNFHLKVEVKVRVFSVDHDSFEFELNDRTKKFFN